MEGVGGTGPPLLQLLKSRCSVLSSWKQPQGFHPPAEPGPAAVGGSFLPWGFCFCVSVFYSWIASQSCGPRVLTLYGFSFLGPSLLSSPQQEMFVEGAFLSLFNSLLGCSLPNENLANQKDSRLLIDILVVQRGKEITKGGRTPTHPRWLRSHAFSGAECVGQFVLWMLRDSSHGLVFDLSSLDHMGSLYLLWGC